MDESVPDGAEIGDVSEARRRKHSGDYVEEAQRSSRRREQARWYQFTPYTPPDMSRYIRSICLFSLGFLLIGGFEPYYIRAFSADREAWRRHVAQLPYRKLPGFQALLVETAARTKPGDRIAIWMPAPRWNRGYEYAYTRSFYLLAGREPLPLINQNNHLQPENLARADYILCWKCESPFNPGKVVFRHPAGSLSMNR